MQILKTIAETRTALHDLRRKAGSEAQLGLVPTMGAIHAGHLSLVHAARRQAEIVAASLFVNPMQFGPNEDLARYPRPFEEDCSLLREAGVDLLFTPDRAEMYPQDVATIVDVPGIGNRLDGASRPGHFRGVATVVSKLLHIIQPDLAFFGQKDAAQLAVIRAMVRDLNLPVRIVGCPIVREPDGLALSSRNVYLSATERHDALALSDSLRLAARRIEDGETDSSLIRDILIDRLGASPRVRLDYAAIVDPNTLLPISNVAHGALIAIAARVGHTRLIDNLLVEPLEQPTSVPLAQKEAAHA
jgi:pantoate--beta-alanine ligase